MVRDADEHGWASSAQAWIARMPEAGDFAREFVLDTPMMTRAAMSGAQTALDIGCGEGRFSRMLGAQGMQVTGIDPVDAFIAHAAARDDAGRYIQGFAEELPFEDRSFDLAVFYLTLIDIEDMPKAVSEAARVVKPGGTVLVANLTSFCTSNGTIGRVQDTEGHEHFPLGHYSDERADWLEWDGLRIRNWHRPLGAYMSAFLDAGMQLTHFEEPSPVGCSQAQIERFRATPFVFLMEWRNS